MSYSTQAPHHLTVRANHDVQGAAHEEGVNAIQQYNGAIHKWTQQLMLQTQVQMQNNLLQTSVQKLDESGNKVQQTNTPTPKML